MVNLDDTRADRAMATGHGRRYFRVAARSLSVALGVSLLRATAGCSGDLPVDQPCTNIPAGGCPLAYGKECDDPACEAAYACREGNRWELDHVCPAHDAGTPNDASAGSNDAARDASDAEASDDAAMAPDAPEGAYGGPGCPPLQSPDCMVGFALACPTDCCDCEDLFVCRNGAWYEWGTCQDGHVIER